MGKRMNILLKSRLKNKYTIISSIVTFIVTFSWLFGSELIQVLFSYGDDVALSYKDYVYFMWDQLLCWEFFMDSMTRYLIFVFPILVSFSTLNIITELESYHVLAAVRYKSRKQSIIRGALWQSFFSSLVVCLPIMFLEIIVDYLLYPGLENLAGFAELFPSGFYHQHPMFLMVVMVLILYIPLAFSYGLISVSVGIMSRNSKLVLIVPEVLYICGNALAMLTKGKTMTDTLDLLTAFNTGRKPGELFMILGMQLFFSSIIFSLAMYMESHRKIIGDTNENKGR